MKKNTGKTKFLLLGLIAHMPQSGYSIKKTIESQFSHFWKESYGQIYPTLKQLEKDHHITSTETPTEGGRPLKTYAITPEGTAVLSQWLQETPDVESMRYEILLKLSFAQSCGPEVILSHLDDFQTRTKEKLTEIESYLNYFSRAESLNNEDQSHTYIELTALCGKYFYSAMIAWATHAEKIISERQVIPK